jgi:hypothetical protein
VTEQQDWYDGYEDPNWQQRSHGARHVASLPHDEQAVPTDPYAAPRRSAHGLPYRQEQPPADAWYDAPPGAGYDQAGHAPLPHQDLGPADSYDHHPTHAGQPSPHPPPPRGADDDTGYLNLSGLRPDLGVGGQPSYRQGHGAGHDSGTYAANGYDSGGYAANGYDSGGYAANGYDSGAYPAAGYDSGSFPTAGYDSGTYPTAGYDSGSFPTAGYQPGYPAEHAGQHQGQPQQPAGYPPPGFDAYPASGGYGDPYPAHADGYAHPAPALPAPDERSLLDDTFAGQPLIASALSSWDAPPRHPGDTSGGYPTVDGYPDAGYAGTDDQDPGFHDPGYAALAAPTAPPADTRLDEPTADGFAVAGAPPGEALDEPAHPGAARAGRVHLGRPHLGRAHPDRPHPQHVVAPARPALLTALGGVLLAVAAETNTVALGVAVALVQAAIVFGWLRLHGCWPSVRSALACWLPVVGGDVAVVNWRTSDPFTPLVAALGVGALLAVVDQLAGWRGRPADEPHPPGTAGVLALGALFTADVFAVLPAAYLIAARQHPGVVGLAALSIAGTTLFWALASSRCGVALTNVLGVLGGAVAGAVAAVTTKLDIGTTGGIVLGVACSIAAVVGARAAGVPMPARRTVSGRPGWLDQFVPVGLPLALGGVAAQVAVLALR